MRFIKKANENLSEENEEQLVEDVRQAIDDLETYLDDAIECCNQIESIFDDLGIHSADIPPYLTNYLDNFINGSGFGSHPSVSEFRTRLKEYLNYSDEDE